MMNVMERWNMERHAGSGKQSLTVSQSTIATQFNPTAASTVEEMAPVRGRRRRLQGGTLLGHSSGCNPSKRHRDRLNVELGQLARLLPFDVDIVARLDKLSVLRLAVSYLRINAYFTAIRNVSRRLSNVWFQRRFLCGNVAIPPYDLSEEDSIQLLQALNGFLLVITSDCEVFYVSPSVEQFLGYHQSVIIHQSLLDYVHSEDRETVRSQLNANNQNCTGCTQNQPNFTTRFRCLLPGSSGFITMEVTGHMKPLYLPGSKQGSLTTALSNGNSKRTAFFAVCRPLGHLLPMYCAPDGAASEVDVFGGRSCKTTDCDDAVFRTQHRLDMSIIALDKRVRLILNLTDSELISKKAYDLIHPDDVRYFACGHSELLKTGSVGFIAYRMLTGTDLTPVWLQTDARITFANSRPDCVIASHRLLSDYEGIELLQKRDNQYKLPYSMMSACRLKDCSDLEPLTPGVISAAVDRQSRVRPTETSPRQSIPPHHFQQHQQQRRQQQQSLASPPTERIDGIEEISGCQLPADVSRKNCPATNGGGDSAENLLSFAGDNFTYGENFLQCLEQQQYHGVSVRSPTVVTDKNNHTPQLTVAKSEAQDYERQLTHADFNDVLPGQFFSSSKWFTQKLPLNADVNRKDELNTSNYDCRLVEALDPLRQYQQHFEQKQLPQAGFTDCFSAMQTTPLPKSSFDNQLLPLVPSFSEEADGTDNLIDNWRSETNSISPAAIVPTFTAYPTATHERNNDVSGGAYNFDSIDGCSTTHQLQYYNSLIYSLYSAEFGTTPDVNSCWHLTDTGSQSAFATTCIR